jgi:hypothetical protein
MVTLSRLTDTAVKGYRPSQFFRWLFAYVLRGPFQALLAQGPNLRRGETGPGFKVCPTQFEDDFLEFNQIKVKRVHSL